MTNISFDAVAAGAALLDEVAPPEWWDRVDFDKLDMESQFNCILGQVFAADADTTGISSGYLYATWDGYSHRGPLCDKAPEGYPNGAWLREHGFLMIEDEDEHPEDGFAAAWFNFIVQRREDVK